MTRGEQAVMEQVINFVEYIPVRKKSRAKMHRLLLLLEDMRADRYKSYQGNAKVLVHGEDDVES